MLNLGNFSEDQTLDFKFNTIDADGDPVTMTSATVKVYKGNSTTTEVTTGVTLTTDFDGMTGTHHVRVDLTDPFYAAGNEFSVVLTAGTVDGKSMAGTVLAHFSIDNRASNVTKWLGSAVAANTAGIPRVDLDLIEGANVNTASAQLGVNVVTGGGGGGGGTVIASGTCSAVSTTTCTFASANRSTVDNKYRFYLIEIWGTGGTTAQQERQVRMILSYNGTSGLITFDVPLAEAPTGTINCEIKPPAFTICSDGTLTYTPASDSLAGMRNASPTLQQVANAVVDEALAGHNVADSLGLAIKNIRDSGLFNLVAHKSTLQAGSTTTVANLATTAPATDLTGHMLYVWNSGLTYSEVRKITSYNTTNKQATVAPAFAAAPASGNSYTVVALEDSWRRVGAPAGASVSADVAAVNTAVSGVNTAVAGVQADTDNIQTRIPATLVGGRIDASIGAVQSNAIVAAGLAADALTAIADAILKRDFSAVTGEASRSLLNAARFLRNKWDAPSGTLTVTKEDDTTTAWTGTLTRTAVDAVTAIDPA